VTEDKSASKSKVLSNAFTVVREAVLKGGDGLVFPTTRCNVINELTVRRSLDDAIDIEMQAHIFSTGQLKWYIPCVQFFLSTQESTDLDAYIMEANAPLPVYEDTTNTCVKTIESMSFTCDVIGATEGGRRCVCGSNDLEAFSRQTRSLDEGPTVKYVCRMCKNMF
jgi:hypothetical protein